MDANTDKKLLSTLFKEGGEVIINNYMSVLKPDDDRIDREIYAAIDDAVSGKFLERMEEFAEKFKEVK